MTMTTAQERAHLSARTPIDPNTHCDRCRMAQAKARVTAVTGDVLYLCAHHFEAHGLAIESDMTLTAYSEANECNCFQCTPPSERKG